MPWEVKRDDRCPISKPFGVVKEGGELEGCHATEDQAQAQQAALYAAEEKSMNESTTVTLDVDVVYEETDDKAVWSTAMVNDLPDSCFLHILPGGEKDGEGKTTPRSLRMFPYKDAGGKVDLPHLRNAIARIPQSNRIEAATKERLQAKARRILEEQGKEQAGLWDRIKAMFSKEEKQTPPANSFMAWKEADAWRWFAVYSNNYRDEDYPPEIISSEAHKEFVAAVDSGDWSYPELWLWHVKGSRVGQSDFLAYDEDTGFALAAGTFDRGKEQVALSLAASDGLLTSHGMPRHELRYDENDRTIITRYRSREISPLPAWAAANKWNPPFNVMSMEVKSMTIPDSKKKFLEELGLDPAEIEARLAERKELLDGAGVESKEVEAENQEQAEVETKEDETTEVVDETEQEPESATVTPTFDMEQFAALIGNTINSAIAPLAERVEALEGKEKTRQEQAEKQAEQEPETPLVVLGNLLKSRVIGAPEARVDGRTKEAQDGPKEAEQELPLPLRSGNPMADTTIARLLAGKTWQEMGRLEN